jgi:hypothetical protein
VQGSTNFAVKKPEKQNLEMVGLVQFCFKYLLHPKGWRFKDG